MPYSTPDKNRIFRERIYTERRCNRCYEVNPDWPKKMCHQCRVRTRVNIARHAKANRLRCREEAFDHYGHVCACCGESNKTFLCFDHINDDGYLLRRGRDSYRANIARWLKKHEWPPQFQILCHNCNFAKRLGTCPHQLQAHQTPLTSLEETGTAVHHGASTATHFGRP